MAHGFKPGKMIYIHDIVGSPWFSTSIQTMLEYSRVQYE